MSSDFMREPGPVRTVQSWCRLRFPALTYSDKEKTRGPSWYQTRVAAAPPISLAALENSDSGDLFSSSRASPNLLRRVPVSNAGFKDVLPSGCPAPTWPGQPPLLDWRVAGQTRSLPKTRGAPLPWERNHIRESESR